ncbi:hypothetical protein PHLCEN_2v13119 [Hermanssonia centrifuga]|uniref:Uncharacterized protein n=1 Tax=Hermanssonia centrifuga TaxID=98765 RepID=A0A2R6NF58_9APHY|nr:hypothetical protein PHLCEN_2v13119 [Hermanssonia centrifuga]
MAEKNKSQNNSKQLSNMDSTYRILPLASNAGVIAESTPLVDSVSHRVALFVILRRLASWEIGFNRFTWWKAL